MKILITGASGFVGRNLLESIEFGPTSNYNVMSTSRKSIGYHCELSDQLQVDYLMRTTKPDVIIHCAAFASPQPTIKNVRAIVENNSQITFNLVTSAMDYVPDIHFVNLSSIVVYGDGNYREEDAFTEGMPCDPTSIYGSSKLMCEQIVDTFCPQSTNLRCSAIIGSKYLTHGVVKAFQDRLQNEEKFFAIGSEPGAIKPYLHISDLSSAIKCVIEDKLYDCYNVCPDDSCSIKDVAEGIMEAYNIYKEIEWRPDLIWKGDNPMIFANNSLLKSYGWAPQFTSKQAVKQSCKKA